MKNALDEWFAEFDVSEAILAYRENSLVKNSIKFTDYIYWNCYSEVKDALKRNEKGGNRNEKI